MRLYTPLVNESSAYSSDKGAWNHSLLHPSLMVQDTFDQSSVLDEYVTRTEPQRTIYKTIHSKKQYVPLFCKLYAAGDWKAPSCKETPSRCSGENCA